VAACTDITGFGLAGHLVEMLIASSCTATLTAQSIPLYDGLQQVLEGGVRSTLHDDNAAIASSIVGLQNGIPPWLFDPQTSGGLLAGVKSDRVDAVLEALKSAGYLHASCIGEVTTCGEGKTPKLQL
jgi:selenide,water dikinase